MLVAATRSGVNDDAVSPLPMWKWIGRPRSCAVAQSGSQCRSARNGSPKRCGSPVNRTPRCPASAHRCISATAASTSQNGVDMIVIEPAVVGRRPVAQEVVVRPHADELQLVVGEGEEALATERRDVRVQHLRPDALGVHVLEPRVRVERGGMALVVVRRPAREGLRPARDGGEAHLVDRRTVEHPLVDAVFGAHHVGHPVPEPGRHPIDPDVGRLGDVGVGVDEPALGRVGVGHARTVPRVPEPQRWSPPSEPPTLGGWPTWRKPSSPGSGSGTTS